jgi:hypothetical protein
LYGFLFVIIVLLSIWCTPYAPAVTIAENGVGRAIIVVAADAIESEQHAAAELGNFLHQVTGASFEIVREGTRGESSIFVGPGAAQQADPAFPTDGLEEDGIVLRTIGEDLILAGGRPRGTLYAVYTFLEEYAGCRWWTPTESTIPKAPTLAAANLNVRYVPQFEYRDTRYPEAGDADFCVRSKLNGIYSRLFIDDGLHNAKQDLKRGGRKYAFHKFERWSWGTSWTIIPPEIYLPDHPEWFAEVPRDQAYHDDVYYGFGADGIPKTAEKQVRPESREQLEEAPFWPLAQLCLTNEDLRREFARNAKLAIAQSPIATWCGVSQVDGVNCCRCGKCMALAREEGAYSGVTMQFANAVSEKIESFTSMPILTMAYHYSRKPPQYTKPRDNVIVMLLTAYDFIQQDRFLSYNMPFTDERNAGFREDFLGWSKICKQLYVWYYVDNHSPPLVPFPNLRNWGPDLKFFAEHDVRGVYGEGHGKELVALRVWLWAKLAWNPNLDAQQLIEEFCGGYYGAAGEHILAYLDGMHNAMEESGTHLPIGIGYGASYLTIQTLSESWAHLAAAESVVQDNPEILYRIRVAQLPVMYVFLMRWDEMQEKAKALGDAWPLPDDKRKILKQFVKTLNKKNIRVMGTQTDREQVETPRLSDVILPLPMLQIQELLDVTSR